MNRWGLAIRHLSHRGLATGFHFPSTQRGMTLSVISVPPYFLHLLAHLLDCLRGLAVGLYEVSCRPISYHPHRSLQSESKTPRLCRNTFIARPPSVPSCG